MLSKRSIKFSVMVQDVEDLLNEEEMSNQKNAFASYFDYEKYNMWSEVHHVYNPLPPSLYIKPAHDAVSTFKQRHFNVRIFFRRLKDVMCLLGSGHHRGASFRKKGTS